MSASAQAASERGRPGLPGEAGLERKRAFREVLGPDDKKDGDLDTDELLKAEGQPRGLRSMPMRS